MDYSVLSDGRMRRAHSREVELDEEDPKYETTLEAQLTMEQYLRIYFANIPAPDRSCLVLRALGYSYKAIGQELKCASSTAWRRVRKWAIVLDDLYKLG